MLELGKKSQQIGTVLDIVSELAEQTNILAINATIEAAGAGDAGKRFGVVADEIRKLADRVAGSTKEIRTLIDDVRSAVNTTVMATETGSKAVDAGNRQFADVTTTFKQVADLVLTTTEAAREIELSTKQQSTAVEQVNVAVTNVAQSTRETEASSSQTLQTARQLATFSRDLLRLVQPQAAATDGRSDPYKYFRIEARELLDQLGKGVLELERGRVAGAGRAPPAAGAHAEGGGARREAARDRRPRARDRGRAGATSLRDGARRPRERIDAVLALLDAMTARCSALALGAASAERRPAEPARAGRSRSRRCAPTWRRWTSSSTASRSCTRSSRRRAERSDPWSAPGTSRS